MPRLEQPILATYDSLANWKPEFGDVAIWSGIFSTWVGIIMEQRDGMLEIVFGGLPVLLVTMGQQEQDKNTYKVPREKISSSIGGTWAILQHNKQKNVNVWYV